MSAKQIILMNCKQHKPNCFSMENWRKDLMEFLSLEQAASTLVEDNRPDEVWSFSKIGNEDTTCSEHFLFEFQNVSASLRFTFFLFLAM